MASVRAELLAYFTHVLLGDALAAEYLVLHLISDVYDDLKSSRELFVCFALSRHPKVIIHFNLPSRSSLLQIQQTRRPPAGEVHAEHQRLPGRWPVHPATLPDTPATGAFCECGRRHLHERTAGFTNLLDPENC